MIKVVEVCKSDSESGERRRSLKRQRNYPSLSSQTKLMVVTCWKLQDAFMLETTL